MKILESESLSYLGNTAQDSVATQPDSFDSFFNDGKRLN